MVQFVRDDSLDGSQRLHRSLRDNQAEPRPTPCGGVVDDHSAPGSRDLGAYLREAVAPAEKIAMSTPSRVATAFRRISSPSTRVDPAERKDAKKRNCAKTELRLFQDRAA